MKSMRQKELIKLLKKNLVINTIEMAERFNVSIETVRRDFDQLEAQGIIRKIYGGAELRYQNAETKAAPLESRRQTLHDVKMVLAKKAASIVPDGAVVALDAGSTILELSRNLCQHNNLTVICGDVYSATELLKNPNNKIFMMGGFLTEYGTSSGSYVKEFLNSITNIDYFICSTDGASPDDGLSTDEEAINELKKRYIKKARTNIALIDHAKFGKRGFYKLCNFDDIDLVITDSGTPKEIINRIRKFGTKVEVVDV